LALGGSLEKSKRGHCVRACCTIRLNRTDWGDRLVLRKLCWTLMVPYFLMLSPWYVNNGVP
jgi:hypothetical protein